jgi:hypothetical protein
MLLELSSVIGLAGGLFTRWMDLKKERETAIRALEALRETNAHELAMRDKDMAMLETEAKNAMALAEVGARKEVDVAAYAALTAAHEADRATYSERLGDLGPKTRFLLVIVDVVRGLTRPSLTILLVAYVGQLMVTIPTSDAMYQMIVEGVLTLAFTAVGFWFGARGTLPTGLKKDAA